MNVLPLGKVPWSLLSELVQKSGYTNRGIIQNAEEGVDVAVLDLKEVFSQVNDIYQTDSIPYLVYKADPITFPTPNPSKYLIIVNKNDLATAGAIPYGITVTFLLPPESTKETLIQLQEDLSSHCKEEKISILGGHTEVTDGVNYPILSASMIGFVPPEYYIPRNPKVGDQIICSGWVGAEGTGILLSEAENYFIDKIGLDDYQKGVSLGKKMDISKRVIECNKEWHESIHLVHDATEGGILAAIYECLAPKKLGCEIMSSKIPIAPVTKKIADILKINALKLISSGAVLFICDKQNASSVTKFLRQENSPVEIIGEVTGKNYPILLDESPIDPPEADHIIKGLENLNKLVKNP
jgi:hydrogenase maturation factor